MADKRVWEVQKPYVNLHCLLGEGPFYEAESNRLRFVDIRKKHLHSIDLAAGPSSVQTLQLDVAISVTADMDGVDPQDKIVVGLKYGLAVLDRHTGAYTYLVQFRHDETSETDYERIRGNDGAADPHGRFWLGAMTDFPHGDPVAEGGLYLLTPKTVELFRSGLTIPNSIGWSPDGRVMYFTHTTQRTVYAMDYDPADGRVSNQRVLYVHDGPGWPDGFRVDVDGYIWHAIYGEGRVVQIAPADGTIRSEIRLPTPHITCPQFVGTELFITTAEAPGMGAEEEELGGAVFRVDVGVQGLPLFRFRHDTLVQAQAQA